MSRTERPYSVQPRHVLRARGHVYEINPGPAQLSPRPEREPSFQRWAGRCDYRRRTVNRLSSYDLEPQLVTGLFDAKQRSKRRLLTYAEIPPLVVNAIVSIEDRRFFQHSGINYGRLVEGVLTPILRHHRMQGGSTLTMQMARAFFLTDERSLRRKLAEMTIAVVLEHRFTKEANPGDLRQPGELRPARIVQHRWLWRSGAGLLRQRHQKRHAARSRSAGGRGEWAQRVFAVPSSGGRDPAPESGATGDVR